MKTLFLPFANLPLVRDPASYHQRYRAYLRSYLWTYVIRPRTFYLADWTCEVGAPGCTGRAEECHHRTYLRWSRGMDRPGEDTIATCRNCHRYVHSHPITVADPANDNEPQFRFIDEDEAA
jgi:hypothetical protein